MALRVFSTKFIGAITAGGSLMVGGGIGLYVHINKGSNTATNNSGQNIQELDDPGINYDYQNLDGLSDGVKTFLKKNDDFIEEKTKTTNVILARVADIPIEKDLQGKKLKCSIETETEVECKLLLVKPNLTYSNIGKVLYSTLKEISSTTTESPKDSLVVVEFSRQAKNLDAFKNKEISIKDDGAEALKVNFDQVLFKEKVSVGAESIDVLIPLKKNLVTYLGWSFDSYKIFQQNPNANSFSCYWKNSENSLVKDASKKQTFDDACRIIAIDYVKSGNETKTGLQRLLDSKTPINKELAGQKDQTLFFKVEIDMNKFYNVNLNPTTALDIIYVKENNTSNDTKDLGMFLISQTIEDGKVKGMAKQMIVKYTGETADATIVDKKTYCLLDADFDIEKDKESGSPSNKSCKVYEINKPEKITQENFESIDINENHITSTTTLTKNSYYAFSLRPALPIEELTSKKPIYLFTENNTKVEQEGETSQTTTRFDFEIVGLIAGFLIPGGHTNLISEIKE